jgi:ABC-type amino acid transport system permease subunit
MVPTLGNYFISAIKDTSLLSVITVQELLFSGQIIAERTYDYFTLYTEVFFLYLVLGSLAIAGVRALERHFARDRTGQSQAPSGSITDPKAA